MPSTLFRALSAIEMSPLRSATLIAPRSRISPSRRRAPFDSTEPFVTRTFISNASSASSELASTRSHHSSDSSYLAPIISARASSAYASIVSEPGSRSSTSSSAGVSSAIARRSRWCDSSTRASSVTAWSTREAVATLAGESFNRARVLHREAFETLVHRRLNGTLVECRLLEWIGGDRPAPVSR